jgi:HK97 family phage prohead protease
MKTNKKHITKFNNKSSLEIQTKANGASVCIIKGYANVSVADRCNEVMPQNCWNLENYMINPVILINHDQSDINSLVGKATLVEPRAEGLYFEAQIGSEGEELTDSQSTVVKLVRQGILKTLSVGFMPHDYEVDKKTGVLTYKNAELLEISLVTVPMNQLSVLTSVKAFNGESEILQIEATKEVEQIEVKEGEKILPTISVEPTNGDYVETPSSDTEDQPDQEEIDIETMKAQIAVMQDQITKLIIDVETLKGEADQSKKSFEQQFDKVSKILEKIVKFIKK